MTLAKSRFNRALLIELAAGTLLLAYLIWSSWLRWPDPWVDFGLFLQNTWLVSEGAKLGVDLNYYYGPLALYAYAALFAIFGASVKVVYVINFFLLLADIFLLRRLLRRISVTASWIALPCFLAMFALGQFIYQGNYNLLAPYKGEVAVGTPLLLLLAVVCAESGGKKMLRRTSLMIGALLSCQILLSTEFFLGAAAVIAVTVFSLRWSRPQVFAFILGVTLPLLAAWIYLMVDIGAASSGLAVFRTLLIVKQKSLIFAEGLRELMGTDRPLYRISLLAQASALLAALSALFFVAGEKLSSWRWGWLTLLVMAVSFPLLIFCSGLHLAFFLLAPKALPAVALTGIVVWARSRQINLEIGVWSALSFALLFRMLLNPMFHYYGFSLAMMATLLIPLLYIEVLPSGAQKRGYFGTGLKYLGWSLACSLFLCAMLVREPFFRHKSYLVSSGVDPIFDWTPELSPRGPSVKQLVEWLAPRLGREDQVLGLPDGHLVNYLLRARRPPPFNISLGELAEFGEDRILESYRMAKPRFVFFYEKESFDDEGGFGATHGQKIQAWVRNEYREVARFGNPQRITLFEAK